MVHTRVESIAAERVSSSSFSVQRRSDLAPAFRDNLHDALLRSGGISANRGAYAVQAGDTLSGIVRSHLNTSGQAATNTAVHAGVQAVLRANRLVNPDLIHPGQPLDLSVLAAASRQSLQVARMERGPLQQGGMAAAVSSSAISAGEAEGIAERVRRILDDGAPKQRDSGASWQRLLGAPGAISSEFGLRQDPFTQRLAFHDGVDIAAPAGTPIYPMASGTVIFSGWRGGYGRTVIVRHEDGVESIYAHAAATLAREGDTVDTNTALATVGSSGRSTGAHLHFEVRRHGRAVNPMRYLDAENA